MRTTVTREYLESRVRDVDYIVLPESTTTICRLRMKNSYLVLGTSACVHVDNFDAALGRKIAYEDAVQKLWPLEGYLLAEELHQRTPPAQPPRIHLVPSAVHDEPYQEP